MKQRPPHKPPSACRSLNVFFSPLRSISLCAKKWKRGKWGKWERQKLEESFGKVSVSHMQILSILPFPPVCPSLSASTHKKDAQVSKICLQTRIKKSDRGFFWRRFRLCSCCPSLTLPYGESEQGFYCCWYEKLCCLAIKSMNYERAWTETEEEINLKFWLSDPSGSEACERIFFLCGVCAALDALNSIRLSILLLRTWIRMYDTSHYILCSLSAVMAVQQLKTH